MMAIKNFSIVLAISATTLSSILFLSEHAASQSSTTEFATLNQGNTGTLKNFTFMEINIMPNSPKEGRPFTVNGFLFSSQPYQYEQWPVIGVDIILQIANGTDNSIINTTSTKTDSNGFFRSIMQSPTLPQNYSGPYPSIKLVAIFEGNENYYPTITPITTISLAYNRQ